MNPKRVNLTFLRVILAGLVICSFGIMFLMMSIYNYSLVTEDVKADAAIILGAAVWGDSPSPVFRERINHAINLHKNEKVDYLIFTGGVGDEDELAESEVAKAYAINNDIPEDVIYIETSSKITFGNLKESKKLINKTGMKSVLIVSDPIHMKRAMAMAKSLGINGYSSPTPTSRYRSWSTKLKFLLSETYYYLGHLLTVRKMTMVN